MFWCDIRVFGKKIVVAYYELRRDCSGTLYYSRIDGISSMQKKRIRDWAKNKPESVRQTVMEVLQHG